ncbi:hypothetical protein BLOT_001667 [Blomia tropicalis]|nr:hypothetical protein BLOT_001667 [Blomia tropicalis]
MIPRRCFSISSRVLLAPNKSASDGSKKSETKKTEPKKEATKKVTEQVKSEAPEQATKVANSNKNEAYEKIMAAAASAPVEKSSNETYQAPEYFAHNKFSFADYIVTMAGQRLPQKSNKVSEIK